MDPVEPTQDSTPKGNRRQEAMAALCITTFVWAFPPLILKETTLPPLTFAAYRLWVGVAIYAVLFLVTRRRLPWRTLKACALGGVIFAVDISLAFGAFRLTSVADATIIGSLSTIAIIIGAGIWFGERLERSDLVFVAASLIGVVIVTVGSSGSPSFSLLGDTLAAIGIFSWTAYWLVSKKAREHAGALEYMATVMFVSALILTVAAPVASGGFAVPTTSDWIGLVAVAFFAGTVGHSLLAWSHQHVAAWTAALILQTQPLVAVVLAWLLLGEKIGPLTAAGGIIVMAATATLVVRTARRSPEELQTDEPTVPST